MRKKSNIYKPKLLPVSSFGQDAISSNTCSPTGCSVHGYSLSRLPAIISLSLSYARIGHMHANHRFFKEPYDRYTCMEIDPKWKQHSAPLCNFRYLCYPSTSISTTLLPHSASSLLSDCIEGADS